MNNDSEIQTILGTDKTILDFWKWGFSDVLTNSLRGIFAEFLVGSAIGAVNQPRIEWDSYDLTLGDKKIEIKSSAFVQSWHTEESKPSAISFDIGLKKEYDYSTNKYSDELKRSADLYVFCLLNKKNHGKVNPLDTNQWKFYVVATKDLNQHFPNQKKVGLNPLRKIAQSISYNELKNAVNELEI
ncbi:hypothetical protein [Gottfriedia solisilvae]|uniref:hypothetical protein n=1 Tax=Gottfriedia solisilvae TaxID=1516104 RepID=UPI003D2F0E2A